MLHFLMLFAYLLAFVHLSSAVNGVIWSKTRRKFVPIFNIPHFAKIQNEILQESKELEQHDFGGGDLRFVYYNVCISIKFCLRKE